MRLDIDEIIQNINIVIGGTRDMQRALQPLVDATADHHTRIHELSPPDAERLRRADTEMAEVLASYAADAAEAAKHIREAVERGKEN